MEGIFTNSISSENQSKRTITLFYPSVTCDLNAAGIHPPVLMLVSAVSADNGVANEMFAQIYAFGIFTTIADGEYRISGMAGPGSHTVVFKIKNGVLTANATVYQAYRWIIMSL